MAARSKARVCGHSIVGIAGSNPTVGIERLSFVLCVVRYRCLQWADHSSRGVLSSVVCLSVISKTQQRGGLDPLELKNHEKKKYKNKKKITKMFYFENLLCGCPLFAANINPLERTSSFSE